MLSISLYPVNEGSKFIYVYYCGGNITTLVIYINTWFCDPGNGYHEGDTMRAKDTNAAILDRGGPRFGRLITPTENTIP